MSKSIYLDIFNIYKNNIVTGKYKPNDKLPSYREIANIYNISRNTANKVICELVKTGLAYNIQGIGTFVNGNVEKPVIAIVADLTSISSQYSNWHKNFIDFTSKKLINLGYIPKLCIGDGDTGKQFITMTHLDDEIFLKSLSGVILDIGLPMLENMLEEYKMPVISTNIAAPTSNSSVVLNYSKMAQMAVEIMKEKNIDKYDVIYYNYSKKRLYPERQIFLEKVYNIINNITNDANKYVPIDCERIENYEENIKLTFMDWWNKKDRADTLFFFEDSILTVCLDVINNLNIEIGKDLKIITHANSKMKFNTKTNLYKIGFNVEECSNLAVNSLDNIIKNNSKEQIIYLDPFIKKGDSLG